MDIDLKQTDEGLPPIRDIYYLENVEQLEAIAEPIRYRMCLLLSKPQTGAQLARALGISRASAHYHLGVLRDAGLVTFSHEGESHGITEKYYQAVAKYLDFSNIIPKDHQSLVPDDVALHSFGAAVRFVANLLDFAREGIDHLQVRQGVGIGFHYILTTELAPTQFRKLRDEMTALKNRVIEMEHENERSSEEACSVPCRITLFLTPMSDNSSGAQPSGPAQADEGGVADLPPGKE